MILGSRLFPDLPGLYDLKTFSTKLPGRKELKKLKGLIAKIEALGSAFGDLQMAQEYLRYASVLDRRTEETGDNDSVHAISAICCWAVVIYVRATHSSSKARGSVPIKDYYDATQKEKHETLAGLRNDAFAHYGAGPNKSMPWSKDSVILRINQQQDMGVFSPPFRRSYQAEVSDAALEMTGVAIDLAHRLFNETQHAFFEEYRLLIPTFPFMKVLLTASRFDAMAYCEDPVYAADLTAHVMDGTKVREKTVYRRPPSSGFFDSHS